MIQQQMNIKFVCDNPECDSDEYWTAYLVLGASDEGIFQEWQYQISYNSWRYVIKTGKIFCSNVCEEMTKE